MKANRRRHHRIEIVREPVAADVFVSPIAAVVADGGPARKQVTDIVQQRGKDKRVGSSGAVGQGGGLQRMLELSHRLPQVRCRAALLQETENPAGQFRTTTV